MISRLVQAGAVVGGAGIAAGGTQPLLFDNFLTGDASFRVPSSHVLILAHALTNSFAAQVTVEITVRGRVLRFAQPTGQLVFRPLIIVNTGEEVTALLRNQNGAAAVAQNTVHSLHGVLVRRDSDGMHLWPDGAPPYFSNAV